MAHPLPKSRWRARRGRCSASAAGCLPLWSPRAIPQAREGGSATKSLRPVLIPTVSSFLGRAGEGAAWESTRWTSPRAAGTARAGRRAKRAFVGRAILANRGTVASRRALRGASAATAVAPLRHSRRRDLVAWLRVAALLFVFAPWAGNARAGVGDVYTYAAQEGDEGSSDFALRVTGGVGESVFRWNGIRHDYGTILIEEVGVFQPAITFVSLSGGFDNELALFFELLGDPGTLFVEAEWLSYFREGDVVEVAEQPSVHGVNNDGPQVNTMQGRIEWQGETLPFGVTGDFCGVGCERTDFIGIDAPPIPFAQTRLPDHSFFFGGKPQAIVQGLGVTWTIDAVHTTQPQGSAGYNVVPEPATAVLFGLGLAAIARSRRALRSRPSWRRSSSDGHWLATRPKWPTPIVVAEHASDRGRQAQCRVGGPSRARG